MSHRQPSVSCLAAAALVAALAVTLAEAAPLPAGPEFRVTTTTAGSQSRSAVAADAAGNVVVVWESQGQDGDGAGIFAQRYDATGASLGGEFQVNTVTAGDQSRPAVAMSAGGGFLVAWEGRPATSGSRGP